MTSILAEIKRRKAFQVSAVYVVIAWLTMQVVDVVNEPLSLPDWFDTVVILLLAIGFPITLLGSWAFDVTDQGVVRDSGSRPHRGRRIEVVLVALLLVAVGFIGYRELGRPGQRAVLPNSVAVLPLENLSPDPDNAFYAAGFHDTILNELAKIADLNVIARTSVLPYAGVQVPIGEIARELNVETVMEGSFQFAEGQVRITAQLIDPATGAHRWSGNYTGPFEDIFAIQSEIATRIADALEAELLPDEQRSIETPATASNAAFVLYWRAKELVPNLGPFLPMALYENLKQALEIDPDYVDAHAALAFAYARSLGLVDSEALAGSIEEHERLALWHADRALEIDPDEGLAFAARAMVDDTYARRAAWVENWERAIAASPDDVEVLDDAVITFGVWGMTDRARELYSRLSELDPRGWGAPYYTALGSKNLERAVTVMRDWVEANPGRGLGVENLTIGVTEAARGEHDAALEQLEIAEQLRSNMSAFELAMLAYAYGRIGRRDDAEAVFARLRSIAEADGADQQPWPQWYALAYLGVGDEAQALHWLESWADDLGPRGGSGIGRALLASNLYDDPVLDQPEFLALRRRLGFED